MIGALLFAPLLAASRAEPTPSQASQMAGACTANCQTIVPVIPSANLAYLNQAGPLAPVVAGGFVYVSDEASDTVSVVSAGGAVVNASVGSEPLAGAYDWDSGYFYVPDSNSSEVSVFVGVGVDTTIQVPSNPVTPAYDPKNGYVYVPDNGGNTVTVVSGASAVASITVGNGPMEPVVNTNVNSKYYGYVYVPNEADWTVSVISPENQVVATLGGSSYMDPNGDSPLPHYPGGGLFDWKNGLVYMGSYVISGTTVLGVLQASNTYDEQGAPLSPSCDYRCVLDTWNGLVYEPLDPNNPDFNGFEIINGTDSIIVYSTATSGSGVFDPQNGWMYMGFAVVGQTPFAYANQLAIYGPDSYDPNTGLIYGVQDFGIGGSQVNTAYGLVAISSVCGAVGGEFNYSVMDQTLCQGAGSPMVNVNSTMTAANTGVNGSGNHIFTIVTGGNIPMAAGNWSATGSKIVDQAGGASISFTLSGQSGSKGTATIQVLKSEVVFLLGLTALGGASGLPTSSGIASWQPQLYIDGLQVSNVTTSQDSTYIYLTFPIHFSTHQVELKWIPAALAVGTNGSAISGTSSTASSETGESSIGTSSNASTITTSSTSASHSNAVNVALPGSYLAVLCVSVATIGAGLALSLVRRERVKGSVSRRTIAPDDSP